MSGQLCLRWNNHAVAFNKLLNKMYLEDTYSDGTILCHGKFYPVHRFVLSTCSEYFEEMFRQCDRLKNKHPFIIVKDIHPEQMEALLNYMYKGEVNVPQEMLPELIKAAEAFKIKGLAVPDEEPCHRPRKRSNASSPTSSAKKSRRQEEKSFSTVNESFSKNIEKSDNCETENSSTRSTQLFESSSRPADKTPIDLDAPSISKIKEEPNDDQEQIAIIDDADELASSLKKEEQHFDTFDEGKAIVESFDFDGSNDNYEDLDPSNDNFEGLDASNDNFIEQEPGSWDSQEYEGGGGTEDDDQAHRWPEHQYPSTSTAGNCEENEASRQFPLGCPFSGCCFKTRSSGNLTLHLRTHTGERPFKCPQCPYRAKQKGNILRHIKIVHLHVKPFECPQCPYKCSRKEHLKMHCLNRHKLML